MDDTSVSNSVAEGSPGCTGCPRSPFKNSGLPFIDCRLICAKNRKIVAWQNAFFATSHDISDSYIHKTAIERICTRQTEFAFRAGSFAKKNNNNKEMR
ncbi:MAG: hypothetical protein BM485_14565 [Desulfobulbaceae bacterium DB1]|nr:MAG: hypothetical protein BM485_14565 [Desulfobulbaceae bacterium DB1]